MSYQQIYHHVISLSDYMFMSWRWHQEVEAMVSEAIPSWKAALPETTGHIHHWIFLINRGEKAAKPLSENGIQHL